MQAELVGAYVRPSFSACIRHLRERYYSPALYCGGLLANENNMCNLPAFTDRINYFVCSPIAQEMHPYIAQAYHVGPNVRRFSTDKVVE